MATEPRSWYSSVRRSTLLNCNGKKTMVQKVADNAVIVIMAISWTRNWSPQ